MSNNGGYSKITWDPRTESFFSHQIIELYSVACGKVEGKKKKQKKVNTSIFIWMGFWIFLDVRNKEMLRRSHLGLWNSRKISNSHKGSRCLSQSPNMSLSITLEKRLKLCSNRVGYDWVLEDCRNPWILASLSKHLAENSLSPEVEAAMNLEIDSAYCLNFSMK